MHHDHELAQDEPRAALTVDILSAAGLNEGADLPGMHAGMSELPDSACRPRPEVAQALETGRGRSKAKPKAKPSRNGRKHAAS